MPKPLRITVRIDFDWPVRRHHGIFTGIQAYASQVGHWQLIPDEFPSPHINRVRNKHSYDAVVGEISQKILRASQRAEIPVVNFGHYSPVKDDLPSVLSDRGRAGEMAAEHLIERGLSRIAFVGFRGDPVTKIFYEGAARVAKQHKVPITRRLVSDRFNQSEASWERFVEGINGWIDTWQFPTGVIATFDGMGRYMTLLCQRRDLDIPEQVALIGAGNERVLCEATTPSLSSIEFGQNRIGYRAAELLDGLLQGQTPTNETIWVSPSDVIARRSTDPYHVGDALVARALRYMAEHCGENMDVDHIARNVFTSRRTLERRFRTLLGTSINDELTKLRIERIKQLLVETNESIKSLAFQSGYGTPEHMRHVFKNAVGLSPAAYRKQNKAQ